MNAATWSSISIFSATPSVKRKFPTALPAAMPGLGPFDGCGAGDDTRKVQAPWILEKWSHIHLAPFDVKLGIVAKLTGSGDFSRLAKLKLRVSQKKHIALRPASESSRPSTRAALETARSPPVPSIAQPAPSG